MFSIAVTGPESTGKTTLCRFLEKKLGACLVEDHTRTYLEIRNGVYAERDLKNIALGYEKQKVEAIQNTEGFLICDTEMTNILIWAEDKFGKVDPLLQKLWEAEEFNLVLLCFPDLTWEPDPLRENSGKGEYFFHKFQDKLNEKFQKFYVIHGNEREEDALKEINRRLLAHN